MGCSDPVLVFYILVGVFTQSWRNFQVVHVLFVKPPASCHVPFSEEWVSIEPLCMKAGPLECCTDGRAISFNHHHKVTLDLTHSDRWVLVFLCDKGPLTLFAQCGQVAKSRKSSSKHLPFKRNRGYFAVDHFQCRIHFLVSFPRSLPCHYPVSEVGLGIVF